MAGMVCHVVGTLYKPRDLFYGLTPKAGRGPKEERMFLVTIISI